MTSPRTAAAVATLVVLSVGVPAVAFAPGPGSGVGTAAATPTVSNGTVSIDFEALPGGGETTHAMGLSDEYREAFGVGFVPGEGADHGATVVDCAAEQFCRGTQWGPMVIAPVRRTEFRNYPLVVDFEEPKRFVVIRARGERRDPPITVEVRMNATDASGGTVDTDTERISSHGGWVRLEVGARDGPARISQVRLSGGWVDSSITSNFLYFDGLAFDGENASVPEDDTPPEVTVTDPGATVTDDRFDLGVRASDDTKLAAVRYFVTDASGEALTPDENRLCGSVGFPCPPGNETFTESVPVSVPGNGTYTLRAEACDAAGNCANATREVTVDREPSPSPPPIRMPATVEVTQGVQNELFEVTGPGTVSSARGITLLANRTTVVRYYLTAEGGTRRVSSAELDVTVWRRDGTRTGVSIEQNTESGAVTVPEDPGTSEARRRLLWRMRADESRTLDFVIPKRVLADAELVDLELEGVTGRVQTSVGRPTVLGITPVVLEGKNVSRPNETKMRGVYQHLHASYPVSDVRIPWGPGGWVSVTGAPGEYPFSWRYMDLGGMEKCSKILGRVHSTYVGDSLPDLDRPDYATTLGVAGGGFDGCSGMAYLSEPSAITFADTNVAPHEIGHTLGLEHASNAHNESEGGGYEEWPYPHGTISASSSLGVDRATFGVIANRTDAGGFGTWDLTVVDPCPTADLSKRLPTCSLPDRRRMHDFMSYGPWSRWTPGTFAGGNAFRWASDITYTRLLAAMSSKDGTLSASGLALREQGVTPAGAPRPATGHSVQRVEALMIGGVVYGNDTVRLSQPVVRKPLPRATLADGNGSLTLRLEAGNGTTLLNRSFGADYAAHGAGEGIFWLAIPYEEGAERLVIERGGETLLVEEASPNEPRVRVTSPDGGEVLAGGEHTVTWEASDPDGDPLSFLVQYSPDGGETWQGITMVDGERTATLNVSGPAPGQRALVRVTASDGFNTAADVSDDPFSLGIAVPEPGDVTGNGEAATDPDGDGLYEDVDGDGAFDIVDVAVFLDVFDTSAVRGNRAAFDFDGDGTINVLDVAELLDET